MDSVDSNPVSDIEVIFDQVISELARVQVGSDEGLLPIYSMFMDIDYVCPSDQPLLIEALSKVKAHFEALFDSSQPMDAQTLETVNDFVFWFRAALMNLRENKVLTQPFESTPIEKVLEEAVSSTSFSSVAEYDFSKSDVLLEIAPNQDPDILDAFIVESIDHLEKIEAALMALEDDLEDLDSVNGLFRSFHTIKGVSGFLLFSPIKDLTHEIESLLDMVRNQKIELNSHIIALVMEGRDLTQALVDQVRIAVKEGKNPMELIVISDLMARVRAVAEGKNLAFIPMESKIVSSVESSRIAEKSIRIGEITSIRVSMAKLDTLLDSVGELVVIQSQLNESTPVGISEDTYFSRSMEQLARITKELRNSSMDLRMIPVKSTFQKLSRIARELSNSMGKIVNVEVFGEETELDRNMIEEVGDPLMHMVRNAIDHGLESPEERVKAGKPEAGILSLKAYQKGSNFVIEISDDGRGIDHEKVLKIAKSKGLASEGCEYTPKDIYSFLFLPGFSLAKKVTEVSGRGVGMDVVFKNIENLRGVIDIDSEIGKGSSFKLSIPLTLAIIDGLIIRVGSSRFILPVSSIRISLHPQPEDISFIKGNVEVLRWGEKTIPIIRLYKRFNIEGAIEDLDDGILLVVETMGRNYALLIDAMLAKQEVVIKNLGPLLQKMHGFSGCTILGDGMVSLILDPVELVKDLDLV